MGQSSQRIQRIAGLSAVAVGPGPFPEPGQSLLLLSRTDIDSRIRLVSAARDLIHKPELYTLISKLDAKSINEASWMMIAFTPDGPVCFKLLSKMEDAIGVAIDIYGGGFAARHHRWATLVFASPTDVLRIQGLLSRFVEDIPPLGQPLPQPQISISQEIEPKLRLEISSDDVEAMDLAPALMTLDAYATSIEWVDRVGPNFVIEFVGYEDDPRFLGEIPSVASYINQIALFAPWAPLVSHPSCYLLWLNSISDKCSIHTDGQGLTRFNFPPGEGDLIIERVMWMAADLAAERLINHNGLPSPRLIAAVQSWVDFLAADGEHFADTDAEALLKESRRSYQEPEPDVDHPARNEKEFWESLVETISLGWLASYDPAQNDGTPVLSGHNVVIYAVDTRTGWIYAAGLHLDQAKNILSMADGIKVAEAAPTLAITTICDLANQGAGPDHAECTLALVASLVALGSTKLLNNVRQQYGDIDGHYLYMIYSKIDGSVMARSSYALWDGHGVMPLQNVYDLAAETIRHDISTPSSLVGSDIKNSGGLVLCAHLQKLLGEKRK